MIGCKCRCKCHGSYKKSEQETVQKFKEIRVKYIEALIELKKYGYQIKVKDRFDREVLVGDPDRFVIFRPEETLP